MRRALITYPIIISLTNSSNVGPYRMAYIFDELLGQGENEIIIPFSLD